MSIDAKRVGNLIRELRSERKTSREELAKNLEIEESLLAQWEDGEALPSVEEALKLAGQFSRTVEELFLGLPLHSAPKKPGMASLKELYKIGAGPSSSHTIGPERACLRFREQTPQADRFGAILYGSLAKTGKGHGTDQVILKTFSPLPCQITFDPVTGDLPHPNTMELIAYREDREIARAKVFSVGGGARRSTFTTSTPSTISGITVKKKDSGSGNTYIRPKDRNSGNI